MAVQKQVQDVLFFLSHTQHSQELVRILFEGDRLFTLSFLQYVQQLPQTSCRRFLVHCGEALLAIRHRQRQDSQNETWLKGRQTKLASIARQLVCQSLHHETLGDTQACVAEIRQWLMASESG